MFVTRRLGQRFGALLIAAGLLVGIVAAPLTPAGAAEGAQVSAAEKAATWIAEEYESSDSQFEPFIPGVLADIIFALAVPGTHQDVAIAALDQLVAGASDYVGPPEALKPGAAAKVILAALVQGEDPDGLVDGRDLEAELRSSMTGDGEIAADVFNHSLAMLALAKTEDGVPAQAAAWLVRHQCDDGDFVYDGDCDAATSDDHDTTALATQALLAANRTPAASKAVDWLVDHQNANGSFSAYGTPNANTTGVAAQALRAGGKTNAADKAAGFISAKLQFGNTADADQVGGIRWVVADTEPNAFATVQGILAFGAPRLDELVAPEFSFLDVEPGSTFAEDIKWLAATGITVGCNPPDNDMFCPTDSVTRGQMAAFLVRGLGLDEVGDVEFVDIEGSVFAEDILALATAGITVGCNPPDNDEFCPAEPVSRQQMAAFLRRGLT